MRLVFQKKWYKWKNTLKSKYFRSAFFIMSIMTTFLFIAGGIYIIFENIKQLEENLEMKANHTALSIQECLSGIRSSAVFMGNLPSVTRVINTKNPSLDQLSKMIQDVTPYSSIYSYESICLFFEESGRIFDSSGGMYYYEDFYNQELLQTLESIESEDTWLINVPYERYYAPSPHIPVIMYIRKLPLYESKKRGYVAVSYSMKNINKVAEASASYPPYTAHVYFKDKLLWSSSDQYRSEWDSGLAVEANEVQLFRNSKKHSSLTSIGTQCTVYVFYRELIASILPLLYQWILLYLLTMSAVMGLAVVYSAVLRQPVDAIMRKAGIVPYTDHFMEQEDEFSLLGTALDNLNAQVSSIKLVMHENQQLVRERLLSGILYNYVDINNLSLEYEKNGIRFLHPYYAIILISLPALEEIEDYTRSEQLKLVVRTNASNAFSVLGITYSLYLDNKSICILLNSKLKDNLQMELTKICIALKSRMKQILSIYPLFSIGLCSAIDPKPWKAWQLARRNFIFTAMDADDFVLFSCQSEFTSSVDPDLLSRFSRAIIDKDSSGLKKLATDFRIHYLEKNMPEEAKRLSTIAFCTIYGALLDVNVELPDGQLNTCLRKLEAAVSIEECDQNFYTCLCAMLHTKSKISGESHSYIRKAVQFLEAHYRQPVTIPQIADYVGVSPIYLTKIFKLSTGKTLSEYLNYYRITVSLDMLRQTEDTINVISESIGYSDVRSYIRFFKKFQGMTPGEYRRAK